MKSAVILFVATLAVAYSSHIPGHAALLHGGAEVLEGPSSRTTVVGPEGSVITSVAPGGQIVTEEHVGGIGIGHTEAVVSAAAPLIAHGYSGVLGHSNIVSHAGYLGHAAPVVAAHSAPLLAHSAEVLAHSAPYVAHSAPYVAHSAQVLAHSAPYVAHSAPILAHSAPYVAHSAPYVAHSAPYVAHSAPYVAHSAPYVAHSAPLLAHSAYAGHAAAVVAPGVVGHSAVVPAEGEAVVSGPSGVVTRAGALHGLAHAAPYALSHHGVVAADTHGDVVVSGPSGSITANGVGVAGVVGHHGAHELAYENLEAW